MKEGDSLILVQRNSKMALADLQVLYTVYHLLYKYQYLIAKLEFYKQIKPQMKYNMHHRGLVLFMLLQTSQTFSFRHSPLHL